MLKQSLKTKIFSKAVLTRFTGSNTICVSNRNIYASTKALNEKKTTTPLGVDRSIENNLVTETNKLSKLKQKFWQNINLNDKIDPGMIHIQMDNKTIRTPMGNQLIVKQDQTILAYLLKNEWNNLESLNAKSYSLPLTSLTSRCIDLESAHKGNVDSELVAKCNGDRKQIISDLLRYLDTDTLLVFAPNEELDGALRKDQDELYIPIIQGVEELLFGYLPEVDMSHSEGLELRRLDLDTDGLRSNVQHVDVREAATNYLKSLSYWNLAVFEKTVMITKSFICGLLLTENVIKKETLPSLKCDIEKMERLASLETIHQAKKWGEVEDTHDVNKADLLRNISAASLVACKE
ncbi:protein Atp12p, mitochondrial [Monosporozyma servazzii]